MRFITIPASVCAGLLLTSFACAQELSPGKYTGSYVAAQAQNLQVMITIDIKGVENGSVTGMGERHTIRQSGKRVQEGCVGTFPLKGTVKGDTIDVQSAEKWGAAGDCQFRLRGTVSGEKILGKIGQNDIELKK